MNAIDCDRVRDLLAPWVREELGAKDRRSVEEHVAGCEECRAEERLLRALHAGVPILPDDLQARVQASIAATTLRRRAWMSPRLAAAAIVVLALGTAVMWRQLPGDGNGVLAEEPLALTWPTDDGFIAGVAMLDDLSDEALAKLLEELGG
jgi:anti-sigma factor RsiW